MAIKYINVGLIEKKKSKCKTKELDDFILEPETTMYLADYLSNLLSDKDKIHVDDLYWLESEDESNFSSIQLETMRKVILEHFDCFKLKDNSSKSTVLSSIKKIVKSFLIIDELLSYKVETESINFHEKLNPIMLSAWKFISQCEPQYQIIIEECIYDDIESTLVRHNLCDGTLKSINANVSFPDAPFEYDNWNIKSNQVNIRTTL